MTDKKVWNSLEVAKLGFALGTPLALFWLSVVVQRDATREQREKEATAEHRATLDRRAALTREEMLRREARRSEAEARDAARHEARLARDEAFQREKALRGEAFGREKALRDEADRKEEVRRRDDEMRQIRDKELQKKFELWAQISPLARNLTQKLSNYTWSQEPEEEELQDLRVSAIDLANIVEAHLSYFSRNFAEAALDFSYRSVDLTDALRRYDDSGDDSQEEFGKIEKMQREHEKLYQNLIRTATDELSLAWPVVPLD